MEKRTFIRLLKLYSLVGLVGLVPSEVEGLVGLTHRDGLQGFLQIRILIAVRYASIKYVINPKNPRTCFALKIPYNIEIVLNVIIESLLCYNALFEAVRL